MNKRRTVLRSISILATASVTGIPLSVFAEAQKVGENDPQALSLGYKHDTTKVDQKKFPKHDVNQQCGNCQFYQGKATDPWGPCTIFNGKLVAAKGWCSAYAKKSA